MTAVTGILHVEASKVSGHAEQVDVIHNIVNMAKHKWSTSDSISPTHLHVGYVHITCLNAQLLLFSMIFDNGVLMVYRFVSDIPSTTL